VLSIIACLFLLKEKVISIILCTFGYSGLELSGFMIFPMMLSKQSNLFIQNIKLGYLPTGAFMLGFLALDATKKCLSIVS
jgi:hypothetical protein